MSTTELPLLEPQLHEFKISRRQSVLSNYDPSAHPPDLDFARNHGKAQKVGHYVPPKQDIQRCPCCLQPIVKAELKITCQLKQLLHLGCAYPLYFYFIKQCIVLLAVNIIICSIPELIINLSQGNICLQLDGNVNQFYTFICQCSVINIMNVAQIDMLQITAIINFTAIVVSIVLVGFIDAGMTWQYNKFYNDYNILPRASDYSVMIKGLPKDITISEIQEFVTNKIVELNQPDAMLLKIYLIYDLKTFYALYSNKRSMIEQITVLQKKLEKINKKIDDLADGSKPLSERTKLTNQKKDTVQRLSQLENKQQLIEIQINKYEQLFQMTADRITNEQPIDLSVDLLANNENKEDSFGENKIKIDMRLKFSGKCILTLNSTQSKEALAKQTRNMYFLQRLGHSLGTCLGEASSTIIITDAPQPSQIIFANIGSQNMRRWKDNIFVTTLLSFCILLDFVLLTLEKKLVKEEKNVQKSNIILSFINSQLIALFNTVVARIIRYFENRTQKHSTLTSYYYSVTSKLVVLCLINMLVTTFFSNLVNYYFIKQKPGTFQRFPLNFQQFLFDIFFLLITNPFTSFFLIFFDHRQGTKYFMRYQIEHNNYPATQAEANLHFQNMQIDISNKYTNIYRFMLFSAGVCFIFPPALIICIITLFGFFWEDKYLLLRRYVVAHKLHFRLTEKMQKMIWAFPLMMSITNLIIMFVPIQDGQAFKQQKYSKAFYYLSVIALITSALIFLGGCKWIVALIDRLFGSKQKMAIKHPQYKDIQMDFEEDYWHHYPYFKLKKRDENVLQNDSSSPRTNSPRKSKVDELHKKMGMDVFQVIKNHLHHDRYAPII